MNAQNPIAQPVVNAKAQLSLAERPREWSLCDQPGVPTVARHRASRATDSPAQRIVLPSRNEGQPRKERTRRVGLGSPEIIRIVSSIADMTTAARTEVSDASASRMVRQNLDRSDRSPARAERHPQERGEGHDECCER